MSNNGDAELTIYDITNRTSGETSCQAAKNAMDACTQAGWLIGDCYVTAQKPRYKSVPDHETVVLVKIPCQVCPFQYAECKKPADVECPARPNAPELNEWLAQAAEAHLCDYYGEELEKTDYHLGQKWLPI
ncbi:unnamed protein product, partial [marine sediment metagenome]